MKDERAEDTRLYVIQAILNSLEYLEGDEKQVKKIFLETVKEFFDGD